MFWKAKHSIALRNKDFEHSDMDKSKKSGLDSSLEFKNIYVPGLFESRILVFAPEFMCRIPFLTYLHKYTFYTSRKWK